MSINERSRSDCLCIVGVWAQTAGRGVAARLLPRRNLQELMRCESRRLVMVLNFFYKFFFL